MDKFFNQFKNYLPVGISGLLASIINAFFWLYLASIIEKTQYGNLSYLISISTIGFSIAYLGLDRAIIVYEAKKENVYSAAYTLGLILSMVSAIIAYIISQNIFVSFLIVGLMIYNLMITSLLSKKEYILFSKYKIITVIIVVASAIILYQILGINGIVLGFVLGSMTGISKLISYLKNSKVSISVLKPKMHFILNNWASNLNLYLFWWADKILIGAIMGFSLLGSYQLASQYILLLYSIPNSLFLYLLPQESSGILNKKLKYYSIILAIILAFVSILVLPQAINIFFEKYQEIIIPVQIMSIGIIPITISIIQESKLVAKEKNKLVMFGSGLQVIVYLTLIIILGGGLGLIGLATAFLTSVIVRVIFNTICISKI